MGASRKRLVFLLGAVAVAAAGQERGRLLGVQAGGDGQASAVTIAGDRPLSFTTMKLPDPPRVVVDFADTEVAAEPRDLSVEDGTIRRVAVAAAGSRTARVVIELQSDAEFDVRATRNDVEIRITRPPQLASTETQTQTRTSTSTSTSTEPASEAEVVASLPKVSLVATKPPPPPKPAPRPTQKLVLASAAHITGIGFRPVRGGEIIVRSDHPLDYGVSGDEKAVLLHLRSARIPVANNRRPLDTRFFDGPVERVVPLPVEGGTDVRIELRARAEYQLEQSGSVLTVTFSTPQ